MSRLRSWPARAPSSRCTLNVPPGALGFNLVLEAPTDDFDALGIERITSPSGEVVHDAYMPQGGSHATSESRFGAIASVSVPQSEAKSANTPEPGAWRIRIGGGNSLSPPPPPPPLDAGVGGGSDGGGGSLGPASLHAEARIQMGSSTGFAGGRLDVDVYLPTGLKLDGKSLDAASAATNEGIGRRLDAFFGALAENVGIDRGEVSFHPVKSSLAFVGDNETLIGAFSASAGRPDAQSLAVMLTNGIDFGEAGGAWGIAPGIPGAAARSGTLMSGIVLAIGDTPAIGDGLTMLHEAGHFIGLNHTTEFMDGYADPLLDTPRCTTLSHEDPSSVQTCPDKSNIMFPAFYAGAGSSIAVSAAQRNVFRGSPFYKAYKEVVVAKGAMSMNAGRAALSVLPGERVSLTRSGRPLRPVEAWLSASLCGHPSHAKLDAPAFAATNGRQVTVAALRAAAVDGDLPGVMRRNAARALRSLGE